MTPCDASYPIFQNGQRKTWEITNRRNRPLPVNHFQVLFQRFFLPGTLAQACFTYFESLAVLYPRNLDETDLHNGREPNVLAGSQASVHSWKAKGLLLQRCKEG